MVPDPPTTRDVHHEDAVIYPVTDNVGESGLQGFIIQTLLVLVRDYFASLGRPVLAGGDQFIYYERGNPRACVAPDVYLIDDETTFPDEVHSWKVWEHGGKVPILALEIVSADYRKDYRHTILERYQQLGVRELIRYDPEPNRDTRRTFTRWLRSPTGILVPQTDPLSDRVRSEVFGFWFAIGHRRSLILTTGPNGETPWRTRPERERDAEAAARQAEAAARTASDARAAEAEAARKAEAARAAEAEAARKAEAARAAEAEAARQAEAAARQAEAAARIASDARAAEAEAEIQRLSAELARLRAE